MKKFFLSLMAVQLLSTLSAQDIKTPQMEIGTNFWDIAWGGPRNQPFTSPWDKFEYARNPWNPEFIEEIGIYTTLRFMDWGKTNSVEREWSKGNDYHKGGWEGRVKYDDPVQKPMAYEWMIDLCNRTDKNMWVTVPHTVDDDYVQALAERIKSQLKPGLQCWVEWSNETWNGGFTQAQYVVKKGAEIPDAKLGGFKYPSNEHYRGQVYHAVRTLEVHKIFQDVFGPDQRDRLVLVMGGAANHAFHDESHLYVIQSKELNPDQVKPDAYALAPYFGHGLKPQDPELFAKLEKDMDEKLKRVATISEKMKAAGIEMVCYEGGQHVGHQLKGVIEIQKDPRMYDLYMRYLNGLSKHMTHFNHYTHTGGSWGAKEFIGEDESKAPKYRALKDWSEKNHP